MSGSFHDLANAFPVAGGGEGKEQRVACHERERDRGV
jgi:hypothetical protein